VVHSRVLPLKLIQITWCWRKALFRSYVQTYCAIWCAHRTHFIV